MRIYIKNLNVKIGARRLVSNLMLNINSGECWCIIGRNGAGKTTLLRTLAGLAEPESGEITLGDKPLDQWPLMSLAKLRSYLPQGHHDAFAHRAIDTVLGARHPYSDGHYWESMSDITSAYAALAELDVAHLAKRDVRSLSGGERQRVAIAAMLAQDAQVMLLDEPTNALDLAHQVSVMRLLSECREIKNRTLLLVSHDLNLAHSVATHALLLMEDGSWLAGTVADTMTPFTLSQCLGHPIEMIQHGEQSVFLPVKK